MSAYIDYYNEKGIIPVQQEVNERHFRRRTHLYKELGCPPLTFKGKSILEIGAGTGDNAIVTSSFEPSCYTFWDGSLPGTEAVKEKIGSGKIKNATAEIMNVFSEEFESDKRVFEIVICEGASAQDNPEYFYQRVLSKINSNKGIGILTTASHLSSLPELLRKIWFLSLRDKSCSEARDIAAKIFSKHLAWLKGASRSAEDWVEDSILHPWPPKYSIDIKEILALCNEEYGGRLEFLGSSSPRFFNDFQWYKECENEGISFNQKVMKKWDTCKICVLDKRLSTNDFIKLGANLGTLVDDLETLSNEIAAQIANIYKPDMGDQLIGDIGYLTQKLEAILCDRPGLECTHESIKDFNEAMPRIIEGELLIPLQSFEQWWGRGQQYLALSY